MSKTEQALRILSDISGTPVAELRPEQDLVADLGIDSPKALKLLVELEDELEIEISDEDAARMTTVGDILQGLE
ncbi:MAG: acyl carrier protein [Planctomycetes bacterium]|nr:acyl carrier protein [Planctomycetota bacterium]